MQNFAQYLLDRAFLRWRNPNKVKQVGALPYAVVEGRPVFLLVTSRRSGRWIVPNGSLIPGQSAAQSAATEALEEAGVEGIVDETPIGSYRTIKKGGMARQVVEVDLYPLRVTQQHDTWAEKDNRHRHWVLLREAKRLLTDPELADLVTEWSRRLMAENQPATKRIDA